MQYQHIIDEYTVVSLSTMEVSNFFDVSRRFKFHESFNFFGKWKD